MLISALGTTGGEGEGVGIYTGLVILAEVVFLWVTKTLEDRSRRNYSVVVFISSQNKNNEMILKREAMFNNDGGDEDSDESGSAEGDRRSEMDRGSIRQR